jgi:RNA polymerase sigma factor (sigma-70 family)
MRNVRKLPARFALKVEGREIDVPAAGAVVGRSSDCWLRLEDGLVSRHHARLDETEDGLLVEDLGSRNGVLVNQQKLSGPTRVAHGDVIGIGLQSMEVVDRHLLKRPETLSTMPPPSPRSQAAEEDAVEETVVASLDQLSAREREVLVLMVHGHTQREIADRLHLSIKTVESHRAHLGEKLGCRTRAELVSYAIAAGILRGK